MIPGNVHKILDYFSRQTPVKYKELMLLLSVSPELAVKDAAVEKKIELNEEELLFISKVLNVRLDVWAHLSLDQKQRAEERINGSIQAIRQAFRLMLVMHNVMFYLGIALIVFGIIIAFQGKTIAGIAFGGVGLADMMFFLIREPIKGIHKSIGNIIQLRTIYNSYIVQLDILQPYEYKYGEEDIPIKHDIAELMHQKTEIALKLVKEIPSEKETEVKSYGT
jgi:hypothetical protein